MKFKRKHLAEALNMNNRGVKHFTKNKLQKVIVSEEQLNRLMSNLIEQDEKDPNLPGGTNQPRIKMLLKVETGVYKNLSMIKLTGTL